MKIINCSGNLEKFLRIKNLVQKNIVKSFPKAKCFLKLHLDLLGERLKITLRV